MCTATCKPQKDQCVIGCLVWHVVEHMAVPIYIVRPIGHHRSGKSLLAIIHRRSRCRRLLT